METEIKELIAVGASINATFYQPYLTYHVGKAREADVTEEKIREAIAVAKMVKKGALSKTDQFTSTVVDASKEKAVVSDGGCGCRTNE